MRRAIFKLLAGFCCGILFVCGACDIDRTVMTQTATPTQTEAAAAPFPEPTPGPTSDGPDSVEEPLPSVIPAYGDGELSKAVNSIGALKGEIATAEGPILLPVFVDEYPTDHEGLLVEATEELYDLAEKRMAGYLELAGVDYWALPAHAGERSEGSYFRDDVPGTDGVAASAKHIAVGVILDTDVIVDETIDLAVLEDNPFYTAAWDYLQLDDPIIEHTVEYRLDGTIREVEYTLYNRGGSAAETILNRSFSVLNVTFWPDSTALIKILDDSHLHTTVETRQMLGHDEALAQASINLTDAENKVLWSVSYSKAVEPGYYVPVYETYILDRVMKGGQTLYQIVDIPATK